MAPALASSSVQRRPPQTRCPGWVTLLVFLRLACLANATPAVDYAAYAGSASCRGCHPAEYQRWSESTHGVAERPLRPETDGRAFAPSRSFQHGAETTTVRTNGGQFQIVTLGLSSNLQPFQVERVIGNMPLVQFLTPFPWRAVSGARSLLRPQVQPVVLRLWRRHPQSRRVSATGRAGA